MACWIVAFFPIYLLFVHVVCSIHRNGITKKKWNGIKSTTKQQRKVLYLRLLLHLRPYFLVSIVSFFFKRAKQTRIQIFAQLRGIFVYNSLLFQLVFIILREVSALTPPGHGKVSCLVVPIQFYAPPTKPNTIEIQWKPIHFYTIKHKRKFLLFSIFFFCSFVVVTLMPPNIHPSRTGPFSIGQPQILLVYLCLYATEGHGQRFALHIAPLLLHFTKYNEIQNNNGTCWYCDANSPQWNRIQSSIQ